ncbi:MAG: phage coat protein [Clostridia bacterium]|nr:phage coat protein [Clostridia bacterium]MBR4576538.1 phage coat protein [Clostridia bacterium]
MPNSKFDSKSFNPQAFKYMVGRIPNLKTNELKKSRALAGNPDIRDVFSSQNGTAYARIAMRGLLDGDAVNYDGATNITATSTKTFEQGVVVIGRAKAWTEKDFSYDITGGVDFMQNVAQQVRDYVDELDQNTLLKILNGIFKMTGTKNVEFVNNHTYQIADVMGATTLNSAIQKACGANKKKFTLTIMHSVVATNLENLKVLTFLTYTDKEGLTREIGLATWNGRLVLIDDEMPTFGTAAEGATYSKTTDTAIDPWKTYYTRSGTSPNYVYTAVASPVASSLGDYYEPSVYDTNYVTYVLGEGCISYEDVGAKVPYEMARDAATNGGQDTLYVRQRKVFAPFGISYEKASQASNSPTDAELEDGANWTLVHSGEVNASDRTYINHKAIPIARIISKG